MPHAKEIFKLGLMVLFSTALAAQTLQAATNPAAAPFHDLSPHRVAMVTVEKDVQLEVLDWGGTGRPVLLLAGSGNTAHIYDDFAPLLAQTYRVYGVTRRGVGASSSPASGYSLARQGQDILAVLDSLKLVRPVLVGHSFAGQELSWVASKHPEKIAGAVYLDAAYGYAFYDPSIGEIAFDLPALQKTLDQFSAAQWDSKLLDKLLQDLPSFEHQLQRQKERLAVIQQVPAGHSQPTPADKTSFAALAAWYASNMVGGNPPEAELRQSFEENADGSVGKGRPHPTISPEDAKWEKFTELHTPVLAIFACPVDYGPAINNLPELRAKIDVFNTTDCQSRANALRQALPAARTVLWPHVYHYLFIAKSSETLKELRSFIDQLPAEADR